MYQGMITVLCSPMVVAIICSAPRAGCAPPTPLPQKVSALVSIHPEALFFKANNTTFRIPRICFVSSFLILPQIIWIPDVSNSNGEIVPSFLLLARAASLCSLSHKTDHLSYAKWRHVESGSVHRSVQVYIGCDMYCCSMLPYPCNDFTNCHPENETCDCALGTLSELRQGEQQILTLISSYTLISFMSESFDTVLSD